MRWTLRSLLVVVILLAVVAVAVVTPMAREIRNAKITSCVGNLCQLWKMQHNYMVMYGGRSEMPRETGGDFWLKLSRTSPPLIDATLYDVYRCPVRGGDDRRTDYRGPAGDVNTFADGDVVGADIGGNHGRGEGGNVLRKSGDVQTVPAGDPMWLNAAVKTRR